LDLIQQELYLKIKQAWTPPTGLTAASGLETHITVRVNRRGDLAGVTLDRRSGNPGMDESVLTAARSVRAVRALPGDYLKPDVEFKFIMRISD
jgi:TonB family protein